jgi:hypothetical protein
MTTHHEFPCQSPIRRVLFICKKRTTEYGELKSSGLLNSARMTAQALAHHGCHTRLVDVFDGNSVDREVYAFKPTHVIIEAFWLTPSKLEELIKLHPTVQWQVRNHSKIPFLAGEGIAIDWCYQYAQLPRYTLSSNSIEAMTNFNNVGIPCVYAPNIYEARIQTPPKRVHGPDLHIGCFGAIRLLKNHLLQAVAAIMVANQTGKNLRFHINIARQEMQGREPLKNLRALFAHQSNHILVEHDWLDHDQFLKLIATMDIGTQVSYTETFNIVSADFVSMGIPIIVSDDINWMPDAAIADCNSAESISNHVMRELSRDRDRIQHENVISLKKYNAKAIQAWISDL